MSESNPLGRKPFLSMIMIISEKFHVDPESLKPWVERGQKVTLTVNNAKHDSSQTFHFFKLVKGPAKVFFSNFWTLRFRNGCFRLVEFDFFRVCDFVCLGNNRWTNPIYVEFTFELCKYRRDIFTKTLRFSTKITQYLKKNYFSKSWG